MTILLVFVRRSGRTALVCTADKTSCFQSGWRLIQRYSWGCFANSRGKIVPAISVSETNPWNEFPLSPKSTCCLASRCWHLLLGTYLPSRDALLSLVTRENLLVQNWEEKGRIREHKSCKGRMDYLGLTKILQGQCPSCCSLTEGAGEG